MCGAPLGEQDVGYVGCVNHRDRTMYKTPKYAPIAGGLLENYYKAVAGKS